MDDSFSCGFNAVTCRSLDLSSVQIWQQLLPHLWRNPDQERLGHDCCSLRGQVWVSLAWQLPSMAALIPLHLVTLSVWSECLVSGRVKICPCFVRPQDQDLACCTWRTQPQLPRGPGTVQERGPCLPPPQLEQQQCCWRVSGCWSCSDWVLRSQIENLDIEYYIS